MKNLHPIGIPHSILFENLFAKTYDPSKLDEDTQPSAGVLSGTRLFHRARNGLASHHAQDGRRGIPCLADSSKQHRHPRRHQAVRGRRPEISFEQHHFLGCEVLPDARGADDAAVRNVQRRRFFHRQAAQGHREHAQAVSAISASSISWWSRLSTRSPTATRSICRCRWTKATSSSCAASISPATPPRATK